MNSSDFDQRFDDGESVLEALDLGGARRLRLEQKRVNVDIPVWMIDQLDREASRLGVTRQSIIKVWLAAIGCRWRLPGDRARFGFGRPVRPSPQSLSSVGPMGILNASLRPSAQKAFHLFDQRLGSLAPGREIQAEFFGFVVVAVLHSERGEGTEG
jgi:hypothetical protein